MKKFLLVLCSAALCLSLSACGGKTAEFSPAKDAAALLNAEGAFATALTQIDQATACALYGIDEAAVTASAVYASPSSAEELAVFSLNSDEAANAAAAQTAAKQLGYRVEDRMEELEDYMPGEMEKLKSAVVEKRGNSVLLVIAADYGPVNDFLE